MVLVIDENTPCVLSFIWTIQNFIYWMGQEGDFLESPTFSTKGATWRLRMYPKGHFQSQFSSILPGFFSQGCTIPGFCAFFLELVTKDTPRPIEINCALGIRTKGGAFDKVDDRQFYFKSTGVEGFPQILFHRQIMDKKKYLLNNNLVLRYRVWKCNYDIQETLHCCARTKIQVTNISKSWKLEKFLSSESNRTLFVEPNETGLPSLTIEVKAGGSCIEEVLDLAIRQMNTPMPHLIKVKACLLDADLRLSCCVEDEYWFTESKGEQKKSLQFISKRKLLSRKDFYLPNDVLTLQMDFIFSFGASTSEVEKIDHGPMTIRRENSRTDVMDPELVLRTWIGNWSHLSSTGMLSDVIIRTQERDHQQHKTILAAHSKTFCEMFQDEQKNVVEIKHLDDETVTRMFKFIYTCSTGVLDWDIALKLFYAAVEFRILALQNMCSIFFRENITIQTACQVLVLAVDEKDEKLKSYARNFILEHSDDVFHSEDWKKLGQTRSDVTSETLQKHFSRE